jgi:Protein of unknown function (DUF3300)
VRLTNGLITMKLLHQGMAVFLCGSVVLASVSNGLAVPTTTSDSQAAPEAVQQGPEQLRQLVAPIALYPDALVGEIMAGATYPSEVVEAEHWMEQHQGLTGEVLAQQVNKQSWDSSVKALTQTPAVLANMSQNLAWTSELGDAYVNQRQSLTQAIQTMRHQAKNAGNLKSTAQQKVVNEGDTIDIQPASTDVVYVPQYDPWIVYGDPLPVFPGWAPWPGLFFDGPGIGFGLGFGIGAFAGFGWGFHHWGTDWHHGGATYDHHSFVSHSRDIVNRNSVNRDSAGHSSHINGRSFAGHDASHTVSHLHAAASSHSSAHAFFHARGFHGGASHHGGFHGGGHGGFHGGGHGGHGR